MKKNMTSGFILFFLWFGLVHLCVRCTGQNGNPRHPGVVHFEELGRISGSGIGALPDLNNDGIRDFAIGRGGSVWLYSGRVGGLPEENGGVQLGPADSDIRILAVGDWDGMNGPDICTRIQVANDTSFGNTELLYTVSRTIVFWNDGQGHFAVSDTTHLSCGVVASFNAGSGVSPDLNGDGVSDLFTYGSGGGIRNGEPVKFPKSFIYLGHQGGRWGRSGIPNTPDWQWWNAPTTPRVDAEDLDQDGAMDIILYHQDIGPRPLSVLYGRHDGMLPDTLEDLQQVDMQTVGGQSSNFADVTGDRIADLVVLNQSQSLVYIYVGCKGQRLLEQFGTGNDPPEGERWWGKPWAAIKGPNHVSDGWFGFGRQLFDLGSADTNGAEEIWVQSSSFFLCYEVSGWVSDGVQYGLDSIFDGEIYPGGTDAKRLGDIDGDGRAEFSLSNNGEIRIYHTAESVRLPTPTFWRVPACDTSLSIAGEQEDMPDGLGVEVLPNPSNGEVRVRWRRGEQRRSGEATITVHDVLGQEVRSFTVAAAQGEAVWDASSAAGGFGGTYFITVVIGELSQTTEVVIRP